MRKIAFRLVCFACGMIAAQSAFAQWTLLDSLGLQLQMTSDYHGIRFTNTISPIPDSGSVWRVYTTDDDWVNDRFQYRGGGAFYGCCHLDKFDFFNDDIGFATVLFQGNASHYRTTDAGLSWASAGIVNATPLYPISLVQAFDDTTEYVIGDHYQGTGVACFRITPSMRTTVFDDSLRMGMFSLVRFVSDSLGFVTNSDSNANSYLLRTADGGQSWSQRLAVGIGGLKAIEFVGQDTGYVGGTNGVFYKSVDGGITWNSLSVNGTPSIRALDFVNANTGFAACDDGLVLRTTDGGLNWTAEQLDSTADFHYVKAINATIAYVQALDGRLFKRNYIAGASEAEGTQPVATVFPNPTKGLANLQLPEGMRLESCSLWNCQGQMLNAGHGLQLDLSELPTGIYFVQIKTNKGIFSTKILKE